MTFRQITEQKKKVFQLQENIKFYQLEIVNREENYNKLFSSSPKVGVMNPLSQSTSKSELTHHDMIGMRMSVMTLMSTAVNFNISNSKTSGTKSFANTANAINALPPLSPKTAAQLASLTQKKAKS